MGDADRKEKKKRIQTEIKQANAEMLCFRLKKSKVESFH